MPLRAFLHEDLTTSGAVPIYGVDRGVDVVYATSLLGVCRERTTKNTALVPWIPIPVSGLDGPEVRRLALMVLGSSVLSLPCSSREEAFNDAQSKLSEVACDLNFRHFLDSSDGLPEGHYIALADPEHVGRLTYNDRCFAILLHNTRGVIYYAPQAEQTPLMEFHGTLAEAQIAAGIIPGQTGQG